MLKYKILAVAIIIVSIFISGAVVLAGFERSNSLDAYNAALQAEQNKGNSSNALYPKITRSAGGLTHCMLVIPKIGVNANIHSDTVDGYNTVYHYPESVNPGQSGECGFLSHRTKYSGLFGKLGSLQIGDEVIIKDYSSNKKYIYKVTANGNDIRWDYEENPIHFSQSGDARLMLVTCYPPGKKEAAYITHCKLMQTSTL